MDNEILVLVFRWLHILPATILVGGTIFLRCAYQPAEQSSEDNDKVRRRWSKLVMLSAGLLLLSGLFNTGRISMGYDLAELLPRTSGHEDPTCLGRVLHFKRTERSQRTSDKSPSERDVVAKRQCLSCRRRCHARG